MNVSVHANRERNYPHRKVRWAKKHLPTLLGVNFAFIKNSEKIISTA